MTLAVVTGATGFVAAELVSQLIKKGYTVRGTVRSASTTRAVQLQNALKDLGPGRLELAEADLLKPGSFDAALQGVQLLFHVASPFAIMVDDPQAQLIRPAVEGTRNVMLAAAKQKETLKRVVLTSSVAAVHDCHCKQKPEVGDKYSEADFNEVSTTEGDPPEGYWLSKVLAEKEAMKLASEHGLDLVTILPEFVMGPLLTAATAETSLSAGFLKGFLEARSEEEVPSGDWTISDVRNVAEAHILAATLPAAKGRYIVSADTSISSRHISNMLKEGFPDLDIVDGKDCPVKGNIDNTKAPHELGLKLIEPQRTIVDMAASLIQLGVAQPRKM